MVRAHRLDLMHYPAFPPLIPPRNFVLTLHDATPWEYPHTMSRKGYLYFRSTLSAWARKANLIITVSQASQQKIIEKFGFTPDKVRIIHHGVRPQLLDSYIENGSPILDRLGIQPGYVLSVGSIEPRKNLPVVIKALAKLRAEGVERRLLIAGRPAWGTAELTNAISEANVADLVVVAGHVTDGELGHLYRNAAFVVQASVHEGFGLPILEAVALGCPVIASAIPAHIEVLGDAGTFFPPSDPNALAAAMGDFLRDTEASAAMKERGLRRARAFSWEQAARETIAGYDDALANGTRT
jgi:glycosyltransferase involved in cell wall biosynthesis